MRDIIPDGFWAAAPKGSITYSFTHVGNFLLLLLLPRPFPLKSQSQGPNSSIVAQIPATRPMSQPSFKAPRLRFGPHGWDLGLQTRIWALRLGFEGEGTGEEEEKIPHVWKHRSLTPLELLPRFLFNFKHNLLRQSMGNADHLTFLRTIIWF